MNINATPAGLLITHNSITPIPLGDHTTIHEQVGGWFDCVATDRLVGYVHDEGLLIGLPLNPIATALFGRVLVGNCVVYSSLNAKGKYDGDNHPLDEDDLLRVATLAETYRIWVEGHIATTGAE